jgi:hypothetical protein
MCDCYEHRCDKKGCKVFVPIHLGDYETDRDEIKVFCGKHIPYNFKGKIYMMTETIKKTDYSMVKLNKGDKIGIKMITENAKRNEEHNHPNCDADEEKQKVKNDFKA